MRVRPLGYLTLALTGLPLLAGALTAVFVRYVILGQSRGDASATVDWYYLFASPGIAMLALVILHVAWWRRRWPYADPAGPRPAGEMRWLAMSAVTGLGIGAYVGSLHGLQIGLHMSAALGYFVLLPIAMLAMIVAQTLWRAGVRLVLLVATLEVAAQVSHSLTQRGRLRYWDDFTVINMSYLAGAMVAALLLLKPSPRLVALAERLRARVPQHGEATTPPPRRA